MAQTKGAKLCYVRGDTALKSFRMTQDGVAIDLTGITDILVTVTSEETGTDTVATPTVQAVFDGSLSGDPTDGRIFYQPQGATEGDRETASEAFVAGEYNYSVRWLDSSLSEITPIAQGGFDLLERKSFG